MDIKVKRNDLINALNVTTKIMKPKATTPTFAFNHFIAVDNQLTIEAMEVSETAKVTLDAEVTEQGEFLANPKLLLAIIKNMDNNNEIILSCQKDKTALKIQYGWNVTNLPLGGNPDDYPKIPEPKNANFMEIETDKLKALIQDTTFACSTDQSRPLFTGACVTMDEKTQFVGTNTHMMALASANNPTKVSKDKIIVPATVLNNLVNTNIKDKTVKTTYDGHMFYVKFDNTLMGTSLIQGAFPDVNRVIPKTFKVKCKMKKTVFEKVLARIKIFADDGNQVIKMETNKNENTLILSASSEKGSSVEAIKLDNLQLQEDDMKVAFNGNYLTQIAKRIKGDNLNILLNTSLSPAVMSQDENNNADTMYVITPIRIAA